MATLTVKAAGGKANTAGTYEPEQVPTASDDITLNAASGKYEVTATLKCRSLDALNYKNTFAWKKQKIELGTSTSNGGLGFRLGAGLTLTEVGELKLLSTSGTEEVITTAGFSLGNMVFKGAGGKWGLAETTKAAVVELLAGELITNGHELKWSSFSQSGAETCVLTLGASLAILNAAGGWAASGSKFTLNPGTSTIELNSENSTFAGGGFTYATVVLVKGTTITGSNTFASLEAKTAAKKRGSFKATTVEGSRNLAVTGGATETTVHNGDEITGVAIPVGAYVTGLTLVGENYTVVEISAAATSTVSVAEEVETFPPGLLVKEGTTQTITTELKTNGSALDTRARIWSTVRGKTFKLVKTSGNVSIDYTVIGDSTAEGGANWYAGGHSVNAGSDTGWKFEVFFTGAAALRGGVALTATGAKSVTGTAIARAAARNTASGAKSASGAATTAAAGRLTGVGAKGASGTASIWSAVRNVAVGAKVAVGEARLRLAGHQEATGTKSAAGSATTPVAARATGMGAKTASGVAVARGAAVSKASGAKGASGAGALRAAARSAVVGFKVSAGEAAGRVAGLLAGSGAKTAQGEPVARGASRLSAAGSKSVVSVAAVQAASGLAVVGRKLAQGAAALRAAARLLGAGEPAVKAVYATASMPRPLFPVVGTPRPLDVGVATPRQLFVSVSEEQ